MPFDVFQLTKNCVMFSKTNWIIWKDLKSVYFNSTRAFESYTDDEFTTTVTALDDELSELELAFDEYAAADTVNTLYDELSDTVESLLTENGFDDDWS